MRFRTLATTMAAAGLMAASAEAATTISGVVVDASQNPIAGVRVRAFDEDINDHDPMGVAFTDGTGRYTITYLARDWDTQTFFRPSARHPDVFVVVEQALCGAGQFRVIARNPTHGNVRPSRDLTDDFQVTNLPRPEVACCRIDAPWPGWLNRRCRGSCGGPLICMDANRNWLGNATSCLCGIEL